MPIPQLQAPRRTCCRGSRFEESLPKGIAQTRRVMPKRTTTLAAHRMLRDRMRLLARSSTSRGRSNASAHPPGGRSHIHGSIGIESSPRVGHLPLGRMHKCVCQRSAHLIERLVFHENGVVETVKHSERRQGETAEDKHLPCAVHDKPPACASILPL